jgi:hypothetical protein
VTPGNLEFVEVVTEMAFTTGAIAAILRLDERRLRSRGLQPAWPPPSRDAVIFGAYLFGWPYACVALVVHFVRSRWSLAGLGLGVLWALAFLGGAILTPALSVAAVDWLGL